MASPEVTSPPRLAIWTLSCVTLARATSVQTVWNWAASSGVTPPVKRMLTFIGPLLLILPELVSGRGTARPWPGGGGAIATAPSQQWNRPQRPGLSKHRSPESAPSQDLANAARHRVSHPAPACRPYHAQSHPPRSPAVRPNNRSPSRSCCWDAGGGISRPSAGLSATAKAALRAGTYLSAICAPARQRPGQAWVQYP